MVAIMPALKARRPSAALPPPVGVLNRPALRHGDLARIAADHGNDPTAAGTDHSRECVPSS
jgi:hypothetical protein